MMWRLVTVGISAVAAIAVAVAVFASAFVATGVAAPTVVIMFAVVNSKPGPVAKFPLDNLGISPPLLPSPAGVLRVVLLLG